MLLGLGRLVALLGVVEFNLVNFAGLELSDGGSFVAFINVVTTWSVVKDCKYILVENMDCFVGLNPRISDGSMVFVQLLVLSEFDSCHLDS